MPRHFKEMQEFAEEEQANELKAKYGPKPEDSEPVPGAEEEGEDSVVAAPADMGAGMDADAIMAELSALPPEELERLLAMAMEQEG